MPAARLWLWGILLILLLLLPGCWDNIELENRAIITAIGIDKGERKKFTVTIQAVVPGQLGGGGQMATERAGAQNPVKVVTTEDDDIIEAITASIKHTGRLPFLPYMEIIIVGEDLAREGLTPLVDLVNRERYMRLRILLAIADGSAREVLETPGAGLQNVPGHFWASAIRTANKHYGRVCICDFFEFGTALFNRGKETLAPRVTIQKVSGQSQATFSGSALFKGDRLAGWLTERETRGYLWATGLLRHGITTVTLPGGKRAALEIRAPKAHRDVFWVEGNPVASLTIKSKHNLNEIHTTGLQLEDPATIDRLESALKESIESEVRAALVKAQESGCDIFGFGQLVRRRYPDKWQRLKEHWDEVFPTLTVQMNVEPTIRRTQQLGNVLKGID